VDWGAAEGSRWGRKGLQPYPWVGEQCPANRRTWGGGGSLIVGIGGALGGVGAVAPSAAGHCSTHRFWVTHSASPSLATVGVGSSLLYGEDVQGGIPTTM
jgi:hypothetical protein